MLTSGLVTVPVQLFTATDVHTIYFHQLRRGASDRIRNKRVNERTGDEVPFDEIDRTADRITQHRLETEEWHDTFQEKAAELLKAKQAGDSIEKAAPPPKSTDVVELVEALQASVERARGKAGGKEAGASARRGSGARNPRTSRAGPR